MADHSDPDPSPLGSFGSAAGSERPNGAPFSFPPSAPRFKLPLWAKFGLMLTIVVLASAGYLTSSLRQRDDVSKPRTVELDSPTEVGAREAVRPFRLTGGDGKSIPFEQFKGQVVILSFWASWCTPCLLEMPTLADVEKEFEGRGLKVVAVSVDEDDGGRTSARDFWKSKAVAFPTFFDLDRKLQGQFKVDMLPSNLVFDRAGRVAFKSFGANDWSSAQTLDLLEALVQEAPQG